MRFVDREDAGRKLARELARYEEDSPLVLGLPRGGVPVAYEVARALGAPLDVWVVRKVGAPGFPELGVGAVAEGGIVFLNEELIREIGATREEIDLIVRRKQQEVAQRVKLFRGSRPSLSVAGRRVILVDDGIATGGTVHAAIEALRFAGARHIILAVPVAASQALEVLAPLVDDVVCTFSTPSLHAIGAWYDDFEQVSDEDVVRLLELSRRKVRVAAQHAATSVDPEEISIPIESGVLRGTLAGPRSPLGLVIFAHGSGSSRMSPRNQYVASKLHAVGLGTLLFDLLTLDEEVRDEQTAEFRFDIELLGARLVQVTDWVEQARQTRGLPIGYFGASTGAAAALVAAAVRPEVRAVVSRGGRPDLAHESLPQVQAPTLFLVGGEDHEVIELNRRASAQMTAPRKLIIVPGATHLFEEPGTLDAVARLAGEWFAQHLQPSAEAPIDAHP